MPRSIASSRKSSLMPRTHCSPNRSQRLQLGFSSVHWTCFSVIKRQLKHFLDTNNTRKRNLCIENNQSCVDSRAVFADGSASLIHSLPIQYLLKKSKTLKPASNHTKNRMCGLDWGTDNAAGKSMIDRSQINRALKLGVFVQLQSKETKGGG